MHNFEGLGERRIHDFGHFFGFGWPKLGLMNTLPLQFLLHFDSRLALDSHFYAAR